MQVTHRNMTQVARPGSFDCMSPCLIQHCGIEVLIFDEKMNMNQLESSFSLLLPDLVALLAALTDSNDSGDVLLLKQVRASPSLQDNIHNRGSKENLTNSLIGHFSSNSVKVITGSRRRTRRRRPHSGTAARPLQYSL